MPIRRADDRMVALGTGLSGTGPGVNIPGGEYTLLMDAAAVSGTISLQLQSPSGAWIDVQAFGLPVRTTGASMAQAGLSLPAGQVRIAFAGTVLNNLNAFLVGAG